MWGRSRVFADEYVEMDAEITLSASEVCSAHKL